MAKIKPFKGYRYNSEKVGDLSSVMAPPYDFISKNEGALYYELNPFNAIRIVSSRKYGEDDPEGPYVRSARFLNDVIKQEIVIQDRKDAIYLYEQKIIVNNEPFYSRGFVALLELTEYEKGSVVPCEKPSTDSTQDKFNMVKEVECNGSMISFKYIDPHKRLNSIIAEVVESAPIMDFGSTDGISQRLWMITNKDMIKTIVSEFEDKLIYIVDGHNRYEAYVEYRDYMRKKETNYTGNEPYNYTLAYLTESQDDGMVQLPVHRLVKFPRGFREEYIVAGAQEHFKVEKIIVDPIDETICETMKKQIATQRKETKIAMYCGGDSFYRLTFKNDSSMKELLPNASDTYRELDLTILNKLVLEDLCNIKEDSSDERVDYTTSIEDGVRAVSQGQYQCMFLVNPVRKYQMTNITMSGELMPKRSLCVFPKPATGVLMYKF